MIALNIIALVTEGLDIEYNRIVDIIGEEVELRVVHSLFMLANKFGPNLRLKREELANYAGTTTETAIRILSKLREKGIVSGSAGRGAIAITDYIQAPELQEDKLQHTDEDHVPIFF